MGGINVVFIASLYTKDALRLHHLSVIDALKTLGCTVSHTHLTDFTIDALHQSHDINYRFHATLLQAIKNAQALIVDITHQSLGIGFVLAEALKMQKPVLALSTEDTPHPIATFLEEHDNFRLHEYRSIEYLKKTLPKLLSEISLKRQKKFNVYLPAELDEYLVESAERHKLTKSAYVRKLLQEDRQHSSSQKA